MAPQTDIFDRTLDKILSARQASRRITTSPGEAERPLGTEAVCQKCGEILTWTEYTSTYGKSVRYWADCTCWAAAVAKARDMSESALAHAADYRAPVILSDVAAIAHFDINSFKPELLAGGEKLLRAAYRWLDSISSAPEGDYHSGPAVALYFYSKGKGRGKTHLAAGMAMEMKARKKVVAFADEIGYVDKLWAADLETRARMADLAGEKAHLTVLDDLGSRDNKPAGLRDAWYSVLNPRWLKRGWTIVTSNRTPEELVERGTIDDAIYSRLKQMTGGKIITFEGTDQRLKGADE